MHKPLLLLLLVATACAAGSAAAPRATALAVYQAPPEPPDPEPRADAPPVLITNATILTAGGKTFSPGYLLMRAGRIEVVGGGDFAPPKDASVVDGSGRFVTPGLIDTHSHLGVYPLPYVKAHADGNEATEPTTPEVWAEHSFWPQDPGLWRAVSGGITAMQVLPGSANLIGGRSFTAKMHPGTAARAMRFPGAPQGLKMACGENPKGVYGDKGGPSTRMGNVAGYRQAFQKALAYRRAWQKYELELSRWRDKGNEEDPPDPPERDFAAETLAQVLDGKILVHVHCYRADEMGLMLDLAQSFGFKIRSFHHALEAYKLARRLAEEGAAASTWADWWGFKLEAWDGIPHNAAMLAAAGGRAIIHSDSPDDIRRLNQEAAKAAAAGRELGLPIDDDTALRWITANPAWALGVDHLTGTLEAGKMADVVVWNRHPLSVYARADQVYVDGHLVYDRAKPAPISDFEVGLPFLGQEAQP